MFCYFKFIQRAFLGFQIGDRRLFVILFEEGLKRILSLPSFLTLRILKWFAGSSDENVVMIKVRRKR